MMLSIYMYVYHVLWDVLQVIAMAHDHIIVHHLVSYGYVLCIMNRIAVRQLVSYSMLHVIVMYHALYNTSSLVS